MQNKKIKDLIMLFSKVINQFNKLHEKPFDFGTTEKLYPAEIHMIQAIGKTGENTVTQLGHSFGVTKGAVSQIVSKLEKKGFITRRRNPEYGREILLNLTKKGWQAYWGHERMHEKTDSELLEFIGNLSEEEILILNKTLNKLDQYINKMLFK